MTLCSTMLHTLSVTRTICFLPPMTSEKPYHLIIHAACTFQKIPVCSQAALLGWQWSYSTKYFPQLWTHGSYVLAPTGDLPTGPGVLTPAFANVQPMAAQCPEGSVDVSALAHVKEVPLGKGFVTLQIDQKSLMERGEGRCYCGAGLAGGETTLSSGTEEEFDRMREFVMEQAKAIKLEKRIHAIWFCVPLNDSHRMVVAAERKFFDNCDTGYGLLTVPVILLATKADTLELQALEQIEDQGLIVDDEGVENLQEEILNNSIEKLKDWLGKTMFPPHDYLSLTAGWLKKIIEGMQKRDAECTPLLTCTANALKEEGLQQLLISTQQSNLGLCVKFAINE
ncbi:hypothetical protein EV401DRAFT_1893326 [Pisolithus croceorrhizus]|nr:hypothetical protein EV401DRAFT_1893326 [Pisolithus croceorrhizus]